MPDSSPPLFATIQLLLCSTQARRDKPRPRLNRNTVAAISRTVLTKQDLPNMHGAPPSHFASLLGGSQAWLCRPRKARPMYPNCLPETMMFQANMQSKSNNSMLLRAAGFGKMQNQSQASATHGKYGAMSFEAKKTRTICFCKATHG